VLAHGGRGEKCLAQDEKHLYWTDSDDGTVTRLPKDGGVPLILAMEQTRPTSLVLDGGHLYWANQGYSRRPEKGTIVRMPLEGGEIETLANGLDSPLRIAVSGQDVFWTSIEDDGLSGTVLRGSTSGAPPVTLATKQKRPLSIAVDGDNVYWANQGHKRPSYFTDGSFVRMPRGEGRKRWIVAKDQSMPGSIVLDETHVYWTTSLMEYTAPFSNGAILRRPRGGGKTTELVSWPETVGFLAVDATHVYWLGRWDGSLFCLPKAGGEPEELMVGEDRIIGIDSLVMDEDFLYWTVGNSEQAGGAVWKLAKRRAG
jgi:hypothetical protein